jgi:putative effector of murein hydrolase LrgA (UPF0299 family)
MKVEYFSVSFLFFSAASAFTSPSKISQNVKFHRAGLSPESPVRHAVVGYLSGSKLRKNSSFRLSSKVQASGDDKSDRMTASKSFLSASLILALDVVFRRLFQRLAIQFPSSLGGCCALFVTLLALPNGDAIFKRLSPGASLLAKWLPVFFVPSLVTLPLATSNIGSAFEVRFLFLGSMDC